MRKPNCTHPEGKIEDLLTRQSRPVDGHDCDYVDARTALIPTAERIADEQVRPANGMNYRKTWDWVRAFFAAMDQLAVERGLVAKIGASATTQMQ